MSAATSTVSATPPAPAIAGAPPTAADQSPQSAAPAGPVQSFTEVLSAHRVESSHDGGDPHGADAKRDPSHGERTAPAKEGAPSSSSVPGQPPPAAPDGAAALPALPGQAVSFAPAVADAAEKSTPAPGGGAVQEPEIAAGPPHAHLAVVATAPTGADAPGAEVSAATTHVAADSDAEGPVGDGPDSAVESSSSPAETSALLGSEPSRSTAVPRTAHAGEVEGFSAAATRAASMPAEATGLIGSAPTSAPLPHLVPESSLGQSGSPRAEGAVLSVVGSAAPSAPTTAQQVANSLDVDDLSTSISRPLSDGNGTYTVTVALHPPELGHLQAVLSLAGNDLSVSLTAQTRSGHDAVANAADALKDQLARGGVNVNVTLRDPGSQAGGDEQYRPPTSSGRAGVLMTESAAAGKPVSPGLVSGQIHLVL